MHGKNIFRLMIFGMNKQTLFTSSGEAIYVDGDDTLQLLSLEDTYGIPDIRAAVERSSCYLCKFFQKSCNANEVNLLLSYF